MATLIQHSYSINDLTRVTGIGRTRLYAELQAGRLKAKKVGTRTIVLDADLQEWLAGLERYRATAA